MKKYTPKTAFLAIAIVFVSTTLLFIPNSFAQQEFAPIGAKWTQNHLIFDGKHHPLLGYFIIESIKDTLINDLSFRVIDADTKRFYTHQDGNKVYYWAHNNVYLLYDYGVTLGDTVEYQLMNCNPDLLPDSYLFIVEQIDSIYIDTIALKRIQSHHVSDPAWKYTYIERMGSMQKVVEDWTWCSCLEVFCIPEWLRCYEDADIFYQTERFLSYKETDCFVEYPTAIKEIVPLPFTISPNPVQQNILVQLVQISSSPIHYTLFNLTGQAIATGFIPPLTSTTSIPVSSLEKGTYLLHLHNQEMQGVEKVVKY